MRRTVSVLADEQCVRILDGTQALAVHVRSWDRTAQIENPVHIQTLVEHKRKASAHRACDRLSADLHTQAAGLHLYGLLSRWSEVMAEPERARWVAELLGWEAQMRSRHSLKRRPRAAYIGRFKPLADFDWQWPTQ